MAISCRAMALPILKLFSFSTPPPRPFFSMDFKRFGERPLSLEKTQKRDIYFLVSACANWGSLKAGAGLLDPFINPESVPLWREVLKLVEENDFTGLPKIRWWCERVLGHEDDEYKVLLVDDVHHNERLVMTVLPLVIPSITAKEARKLFRESRKNCFAVVTSTSEADAELIVEAMMQCGLRSAIVPAFSH